MTDSPITLTCVESVLIIIIMIIVDIYDAVIPLKTHICDKRVGAQRLTAHHRPPISFCYAIS